MKTRLDFIMPVGTGAFPKMDFRLKDMANIVQGFFYSYPPPQQFFSGGKVFNDNPRHRLRLRE
jgi:hypothetical protein